MNDLDRIKKNAGLLNEGVLDWIGRKTGTKTTKGMPPADQAPEWASYFLAARQVREFEHIPQSHRQY